MDRTLLLMRHAEASAGLMGSDHDRALSPAGVEQAREIGAWLATLGPIDHVLVSAATRARQTLDEAVSGGAQVGSVDVHEELYEAPVPRILAALGALPDEARTVLVVAHAPGIPGLALRLLPEVEGNPWANAAAGRGWQPATVARLAVPCPFRELAPGSSQLVEMHRPQT